MRNFIAAVKSGLQLPGSTAGAWSEGQVADYTGLEALGRRSLLSNGVVFRNPGSGLSGSPPGANR